MFSEFPSRLRRTAPCSRALACVAVAAIASVAALAEPPRATIELAPEPTPVSHGLTLDTAVNYALQNNPEIAAVRQQHGIAAAGVVIARTYPFNPTLESRVRFAGGPLSATVTNPVPFEHTVLLEWEIRHQRRYRREEAVAALSRTDAEIAFQEMNLAIRVIRAFNTAVYRRDKLRLAEEVFRINADAARRAQQLMQQAHGVRPPDLIVARAEALATQTLIGPARTAVVAARYDLNRLLGVVDEGEELAGALPAAPREWNRDALVDSALGQRPDLRARRAAVAESGAALRLEIANRFGNPTFGPAFEYDPTEIQMIGGQFIVPLPILNLHRGEIMQREAQQGQAVMQLRQSEFEIRQDVNSALAELESAKRSLEVYEAQVVELEKALKAMERLFESAEVDTLRVIDVRRKLIQARDGRLDAQFDISQSLANLAAAVGDPTLAINVPAIMGADQEIRP